MGPDAESEQWVAEVAAAAGCPHVILQKTRSGDHAVAVSLPNVSAWLGHPPVLVDDIISTARTMAAAAGALRAAGMVAPVCVAVHALFAPDASAVLAGAGVVDIRSCNTVAHASNRIDLCPYIAAAVVDQLGERNGRATTKHIE
ncbi:phosphoribosyltransferase family protein [Massilia glaciei]|uniref:phosphoribosyltransferase family protein n=1 Tax=Massilia glaciei TaxID=1524097 RepID=UPI0026AB5C32|nr:phosphoribosyltransferase family protein [Massilia glaciei]